MARLRIAVPDEKILLDGNGTFLAQGTAPEVDHGRNVTGQLLNSAGEVVSVAEPQALYPTPNWAVRFFPGPLEPDEEYTLEVWVAGAPNIQGRKDGLTLPVYYTAGDLTVTYPVPYQSVPCVFYAYGTKGADTGTPTGIMRPPTGADIVGVPFTSTGTSWCIQFSGLTPGVTYTMIISLAGQTVDVAGIRASQGP